MREPPPDAALHQLGRLGVSRETTEDLSVFVSELTKWTRAVNLVSPHDIDDIWSRHIVDSLQIAPLLEREEGLWVDLGSGGGLPAIPLAIFLKHNHRAPPLALVEADRRKAAFLDAMVRLFELDATVHKKRFDALQPIEAHVATARAVAPLTTLLSHATQHLVSRGALIAMKGATWRQEIHEAQKSWRFTHVSCDSITDPRAKIIVCKEIERA